MSTQSARSSVERSRETWRLPPALADPWLKEAERLRKFGLKAGAALYRQGEISPYFYVILKGHIRVSMLRRTAPSLFWS